MVTKADFSAYQSKNVAAIKELLTGIGTRPVLFLGSGITRRYVGAPNWMDLLRAVAKAAKVKDGRFNFLSQKAENKPAQLGSLLIEPIHEWAWSAGKKSFPKATSKRRRRSRSF